MKKEMLINAVLPEETRIAIVEDRVLEELYVERLAAENIVGNIYKGRIVNIEPSIQAAFVDFGIGRNGFLHISDVDPSYYEDGGLVEEIKSGSRPSRARGDETSDSPKPRRGDSSPRRDDRRRPDDAPTDEEEVDTDPRERSSTPRDASEQGEDEERPRRRRRGRGRGRGRSRSTTPSAQEESFEPPSTEDDAEPIERSRLPDLEDYRIEDDEELHEEYAEPAPMPVDELPVEEPIETDDDFGVGLLGDEETDDEDEDEDDDDDRPSSPPADAVYRRTEPGEDEFDWPSFGDDDSDDADDDSPAGELVADDDDDVDSATDAGATESLRQDRYEDEDLFAGFQEDDDDDDEEDDDQSPVANDRSEPDAEEDQADRPPRRGRGRRGRGNSGRSREITASSDDETENRSAGEESRRRWSEDDDEQDDRPPRRDRSESRGSTRGRRDRDRGSGNGRRPGGRRDSQRWTDPRRPKDRPPIDRVFRRGQEVVVQVIKEGVGNKGPTLSTYISIPGRCLVCMPGLDRVGVSRKILDPTQRRRLRDIMNDLDRPQGVGFIVRTAGMDRSAEELERDLNYLSKLWDVVVKRIRQQPAPTVVYQESDVIIRTLRDIFNDSVDTIWIDERSAYERAREFMRMIMPNFVDRVRLYDDPNPMFNKFHIEEEIFRIQRRTVPLAKGGSIVIEQTEALVAIDVNSGTFRTEGNAEETAYQMNLAAAKEIARQLRLRDLGGVIVNDFIDMREERHRRGVENTLRDAIARDRAKTKVLRMSAFGLIEMTRQRIRPSLRRHLYRECHVCTGTGHVKTIESMSIDCMRLLIYVGQTGKPRAIQLVVDSPVAEFLNNFKRKELASIEDQWRVNINISGRTMSSPEEIELHCYDAGGHELSMNVDHLMGRRDKDPLKPQRPSAD